MKHVILLAGAAALAAAGPVLAKPGHGNGNGHGGGGCPPGLAKKNNGCMPPGQARKLSRGQRYVNGYGSLYTYNRIPSDVRRRYRLNARYRYYYDNGNLYAVDPRTMLVEQVISALLR
jgi:hypothetical protein